MRGEVERSLVRCEATDDGFSATFVFAPDLSVFAGHFPGHPIVPAVYLLESVRVAAERVSGAPLRIAAIHDAKFLSVVLPGHEVAVEAERVGAIWRATLSGGSTIRLRLEPD